MSMVKICGAPIPPKGYYACDAALGHEGAHSTSYLGVGEQESRRRHPAGKRRRPIDVEFESFVRTLNAELVINEFTVTVTGVNETRSISWDHLTERQVNPVMAYLDLDKGRWVDTAKCAHVLGECDCEL